jgi:hypothetical protein
LLMKNEKVKLKTGEDKSKEILKGVGNGSWK